MAVFIQQHWKTLVILAVLALCLCLAVRKLIHDKKRGVGACGQECSRCPMNETCNTRQPEQTE